MIMYIDSIWFSFLSQTVLDHDR